MITQSPGCSSPRWHSGKEQPLQTRLSASIAQDRLVFEASSSCSLRPTTISSSTAIFKHYKIGWPWGNVSSHSLQPATSCGPTTRDSNLEVTCQLNLLFNNHRSLTTQRHPIPSLDVHTPIASQHGSVSTMEHRIIATATRQCQFNSLTKDTSSLH